jgi:predicted unusual protein kinase regulating ubiquinone biosynthesis (AarF/ABC1/UbiB family)
MPLLPAVTSRVLREVFRNQDTPKTARELLAYLERKRLIDPKSANAVRAGLARDVGEAGRTAAADMVTQLEDAGLDSEVASALRAGLAKAGDLESLASDWRQGGEARRTAADDVLGRAQRAGVVEPHQADALRARLDEFEAGLDEFEALTASLPQGTGARRTAVEYVLAKLERGEQLDPADVAYLRRGLTTLDGLSALTGNLREGGEARRTALEGLLGKLEDGEKLDDAELDTLRTALSTLYGLSALTGNLREGGDARRTALEGLLGKLEDGQKLDDGELKILRTALSTLYGLSALTGNVREGGDGRRAALEALLGKLEDGQNLDGAELDTLRTALSTLYGLSALTGNLREGGDARRTALEGLLGKLEDGQELDDGELQILRTALSTLYGLSALTGNLREGGDARRTALEALLGKLEDGQQLDTAELDTLRTALSTLYGLLGLTGDLHEGGDARRTALEGLLGKLEQGQKLDAAELNNLRAALSTLYELSALTGNLHEGGDARRAALEGLLGKLEQGQKLDASELNTLRSALSTLYGLSALTGNLREGGDARRTALEGLFGKLEQGQKLDDAELDTLRSALSTLYGLSALTGNLREGGDARRTALEELLGKLERGEKLHPTDLATLRTALAKLDELSALTANLRQGGDAQRTAAKDVLTRLERGEGPGRAANVRLAASRLRKMGDARATLAQVDTEPFTHARDAFQDFDLPSEQRRAAIQAATGPALTDATVTLAKAAAPFAPPDAFASFGVQVEERVRPDGELRDPIAREWWSALLPRDVGAAGAKLDSMLADVDDPSFRQQADATLNVLRAVVALESDNLERIVVHVPKENVPAVKAAITDYVTETVDAVLEAGGQREPETASQIRHLTEALLELRATLAKNTPKAAVELVRLQSQLQALTPKLRESLMTLASDPDAFTKDKELLATLQSAGETLKAELDRNVDTTPEGRAAIDALFNDLTATARVEINLARLLGGWTNPKMNNDERAEVIKTAIENMGPLFVKLFQTAADQPMLFEVAEKQAAKAVEKGQLKETSRLSNITMPTDDKDHPINIALKKLQNQVTPMDESDVLAQLEQSLETKVEVRTDAEGRRIAVPLPRPGQAPSYPSFVSIELDSFASASIGQCHHAVVMRKRTPLSKPEPYEVVVKVQRVDLEKEFESTVHVSRLALSMIREGLKLKESMPAEQREILQRKIGLFEAMLGQFVESFKVEMDFRNEARWTEEFAADARNDPHIVAPKIVKELSSEIVLVMQDMKGDQLETVLERYKHAEEARLTPLPKGPLDATDPLADAVRRATLWTEQTYGLKPKGNPMVKPRQGGGWHVRFELPSRANPESEVEIKSNGKLTATSRVPNLTEKGLLQLRDRLIASFTSQVLVHGLVHGDFHQGNFLVMGDCETVAVIDYGNMIDMKKKDIAPLARLALGWRRQDAAAVASAMFGLTLQRDTASKEERQKILDALTPAFEKVMKEQGSEVDVEELFNVVSQVAFEHNLTISALYLQSFKTSMAVSGNILAFAEAEVDKELRKSRARIGRSVLGDAASKASPHRFVGGMMKNRRVRNLNGN